MRKNEICYSDLSEEQQHIIEAQISANDNYEQIFLPELRKNLEEKEWYILEKIYIERKAVSQIAKEKGISRQAVNQMKNRALKKIWSYFE